MQHFERLLEKEDSNLALILWLGLSGLQTQLQEALDLSKIEDPGRGACQELLRELELLLTTNSPNRASAKSLPIPLFPTPPISPNDESSKVGDLISASERESTEDNSSWEDVLEPVHSTSSELKLRPISETLLSAPELSNYIGQYQFNSTNDNGLWNEIQLLLLRVPERKANTWRERIRRLVNELGSSEDNRSVRQLPFTRKESLYPGLTGSIKASGLRLSDQPKFDPQLMIETRDEELGFQAGVVSTYLKFIDELDKSNLHHALKSVDRFGVRSLNSDTERAKYEKALRERFRRLQVTADADPAIALRAALDLDEALHSLVYLPPAERYSWWGKLQQEARLTLEHWVDKARHAGYQVQIRPLWGIFADVRSLSRDNLQLESGGIPGEVSACLRVYAKINDEILPGRVLFRSS